METKISSKIHNKFRVEVRNIETDIIEQEAYAENIVLDRMFPILAGASAYFINIQYGTGEGTPTADRSTLFNKLGAINPITSSIVLKDPREEPSTRVSTIKIIPGQHLNETITEVGIGDSESTIVTHAMLKDSLGNPIGIGPLTDLQEVTIYATVYATMVVPSYIQMILTHGTNSNPFLMNLLGYSNSVLYKTNNYQDDYAAAGANLLAYDLKDMYTRPTMPRYSDTLGKNQTSAWFASYDSLTRTRSSRRIRYQTTMFNGKIWSLYYYFGSNSSGSAHGIFVLQFPNELWPGYQFERIPVGMGNGTSTKFILPWSDINDTKDYAFYVDNELVIKNTDYTLSNSLSETSITFTNPVADTLEITGTWWVDYIPKDIEHLVDFYITETFSEGM